MVLVAASWLGVLKTVLMFSKVFGAAGFCSGLASGDRDFDLDLDLDLDRDRDRDLEGVLRWLWLWLWWLLRLWCRWLWLLLWLCSRDGERDLRWVCCTLPCRFA